MSTVEILTCERETGYESFELLVQRRQTVPLKNLLITHLAQSPMFLQILSLAEMVKQQDAETQVLLCQKKDDTDGIIAYIGHGIRRKLACETADGEYLRRVHATVS